MDNEISYQILAEMKKMNERVGIIQEEVTGLKELNEKITMDISGIGSMLLGVKNKVNQLDDKEKGERRCVKKNKNQPR